MGAGDVVLNSLITIRQPFSNETRGRKVVAFIKVRLGNQSVQTWKIIQTYRMKLAALVKLRRYILQQIASDMLQPGLSRQPMNLVTEAQQVFRQIESILAGDAGDKRAFHKKESD